MLKKEHRASHSRLSVSTFGSIGVIQNEVIVFRDGLHLTLRETITYKVRTTIHLYGDIEIKAVRIPTHQMKYEEPMACVIDLDTDQGLSLGH